MLQHILGKHLVDKIITKKYVLLSPHKLKHKQLHNDPNEAYFSYLPHPDKQKTESHFEDLATWIQAWALFLATTMQNQIILAKLVVEHEKMVKSW